MHWYYCQYQRKTEVKMLRDLEHLGWRKGKQKGRKQFPKPWTWTSTLGGRVRVPRVTPAGYARLGIVLSPFDFAVGIFSAN